MRQFTLCDGLCGVGRLHEAVHCVHCNVPVEWLVLVCRTPLSYCLPPPTHPLTVLTKVLQ